MKKFTALLGTAVLCATATFANAAERPDIYVVKFRADDCANCAVMENKLDNAMNMVRSSKVELVTIDTSNALKWEVSAHTAFDRNITKQYNKWVGLTGFTAVIDRQSGRTLGCLDDNEDVYKSANYIKAAAGLPHDQAVSNRSTQFRCPAAHNVDPGK